jgi:hypothetical protein
LIRPLQVGQLQIVEAKVEVLLESLLLVRVHAPPKLPRELDLGSPEHIELGRHNRIAPATNVTSGGAAQEVSLLCSRRVTPPWRWGSPPGGISGHVYKKHGARGSSWYYRARLPHGEVRRKLGPVWDGKGRPPDGYYTRQTARAALDAILTDARRGVLPGLVRTGATVGDACDEWLRYVEEDRQRNPSTVKSYRYSVEAFFRPTFGTVALERVATAMIEACTA